MIVREVTPEDYAEVAALLTSVRGDGLYTERGVRHRIEARPERAAAASWVADDDGVIAYAVAMRRWWHAANDAYAWVGVVPDARGRGVGWALWDAAEGHAKLLGAARLFSDVVHDPAGDAFLKTRGFRLDRIDYVSKVEPASVDLAQLDQLREDAGRDGYSVTSLRDVADREALYRLDVELSNDMPGSDSPHSFSFEEWEQDLLEDPDLDLDGSVVVLHDGRPVAVALLTVDPDARRARNEMTGTAREHRGHRLATLAKLEAIRWARENGIESIITDNAEQNAAMLAINERLGYKRFLERRRWIKELNDQGATR